MLLAPCRRALIVFATLTSLVSGFSHVVHGQSLQYFVASMPLALLLKILIEQGGFIAEVEVASDAVVERRTFVGPLSTVLDKLAAEFAFTWVSTGGVVYISSNDRVVTRSVRLGGRGRDETQSFLTRLNLETRPDLVRLAEDGESVELRGPSKFVSLTTDLLGSLGPPKPEAEVRVIRSGKVGGPE